MHTDAWSNAVSFLKCKQAPNLDTLLSVLQIAAIIAIALLDYADFALIVALLIVNSVISYIEESNADKAIKVCDAFKCAVGNNYS